MQQNPWTPPPPTTAPTNIPNYLVWAILSVLCCWPASIVAIVYAAQVNGKIAAGDIQGAMAASKNAKMWTFISIGVGLAISVIYILFIVVAGGLGAISGSR